MRFPSLIALMMVGVMLTPAFAGDTKDAPSAPAEPTAPTAAVEPATEPPAPANDDARAGEAPLPASSGWHASLVIDNGGVGIWTVKSFQVFDHLGCPEVVGLDDKGRCHVLMSYSGRWTPISVLHDGTWLGGLAHGEVDPRVPGAELYTGSKRGNIYQVRAHGTTLVDGRLIAQLPGREIHTIVAGDLDPRTPGREVIVFTRPGGLYRLTPTGKDGGFEVTHLMDLKGRIRDAVVLPAAAGAPRDIATVSRTGRLEMLRIGRDGPVWRTIYEAPMGMGRIALGHGSEGAVLYSTHDDGRILRHERAGTTWRTDTIYHGPQGPRGIAAGRFHEDANVETIAIFGYSGRCELLTRTPEGWRAELLFQDEHKGHWLCTAEVDGRNATREILTSGYSGRVVLLARPPGYGRAEPASPRVPVALPPR